MRARRDLPYFLVHDLCLRCKSNSDHFNDEKVVNKEGESEEEGGEALPSLRSPLGCFPTSLPDL